MHRDELAMQMRREVADLDPVAVEAPPQIVAIGLALGGHVEIEQARRAGNLERLVPQPRRPFGEMVERIERGLIAEELRQKTDRPLDSLNRPFHGKGSQARPSFERTARSINRTARSPSLTTGTRPSTPSPLNRTSAGEGKRV